MRLARGAVGQCRVGGVTEDREVPNSVTEKSVTWVNVTVERELSVVGCDVR